MGVRLEIIPLIERMDFSLAFRSFLFVVLSLADF
jgi:hypothetical protein